MSPKELRQSLIRQTLVIRLAEELHKQLRKIYFRSKDNIWNAYLTMTQENSFKYILTVLDGYTRYAWAVLWKDKKGNSSKRF